MPEEIIPVLGFIIYIVLNVLGVVGKNKNKKPTSTPTPPPVNPEQKKPRRNIFEEFERQMKELEQAEKKQSPPPIPVEAEEEPYLSPGQEHKPLTTYKPISAEILKAPYSNLEEGIIDDVHKSKFPHHKETKRQVKPKKKSKIFGQANVKDAFVASLVFERKYFDV